MDRTWNPMCFEFRNTLGLGHVLESHPWDRLWVETAKKEERKKEAKWGLSFGSPCPCWRVVLSIYWFSIGIAIFSFICTYWHDTSMGIMFIFTYKASVNTNGETLALHFNVFSGHLTRCNMCFDGSWRFEKWNAYMWWTFHFFKMPIFIFFLFLFIMIFSRYPLSIMGIFFKRRRAWWFYSP